MNFRPYSIYKELLNETHIMIAGTTGSGKSTILNELIYTAQFEDNISLILIDPKRVEFLQWMDNRKVSRYVYDPNDIYDTLKSVEKLMDQRFERMMSRNQKLSDENRIYIIIDELADLMTFDNSSEIKKVLSRIGRLGRASKIHLVLATQNPSRSRCGGLPAEIVQNMTASLALRCRSRIESRQIIGKAGAEELPKYGKGIYFNSDGYQYVNLPATDQEVIDILIQETKRR